MYITTHTHTHTGHNWYDMAGDNSIQSKLLLDDVLLRVWVRVDIHRVDARWATQLFWIKMGIFCRVWCPFDSCYGMSTYACVLIVHACIHSMGLDSWYCIHTSVHACACATHMYVRAPVFYECVHERINNLALLEGTRHTYIHTHACMHTSGCHTLSTCIHVLICIHTSIHLHLYIPSYILYSYACESVTYTYTCMHIHTHTYTWVAVYVLTVCCSVCTGNVYIYMHTHTHTYTYIDCSIRSHCLLERPCGPRASLFLLCSQQQACREYT